MRVYLPSTLPALKRVLAVGQVTPGQVTPGPVVPGPVVPSQVTPGPVVPGPGGGSQPGRGQVGYAVTPTLREAYASGDQEELEYVAMTAAALASLRLLANDPGAPPRRVVLAADIDDTQVSVTGSGADHPAAVLITGPIPVAKLVSAHVDDEQASRDIKGAIEALPAADAGDEDAAFDVDQAEGNELGWYASQELPDLIR
jgi:hypothetical protein